MNSGQKAKMMIMRGLGYSQKSIAREFGITRSAISKQLRIIRKRCEDEEEKEGYLRIFFEMLIYSDELDYSSIIAFGNQKYTYENLRYQGMTRLHALRYASSGQAAVNPPWIANPDFDGSHITARNYLWREESE